MGALDDLFADLLTGGSVRRKSTSGDSGDTGDKPAFVRAREAPGDDDKLATPGDKLPKSIALSPGVATLSPIGNQPESEQRCDLSPISPTSPWVSPAVPSPTLSRTCANCLHLLKPGTCGNQGATGLGSMFEIWWPPEGYGAGCRAFNTQMPAEVPVRPYKLSKASSDRCHAGGWDDTEIERFKIRRDRMLRLGYGVDDADDLAERLTLRDRERDTRHMCTECRQGRSHRCANGVPLPGEVLHHCEGFKG